MRVNEAQALRVRDSSEKPTATQERGLATDSPTSAPFENIQPKVSKQAEVTPKTNSELGFLTPVVRKIIAEHEIEISELQRLRGSGNNGRITKKDIEDYLAEKAAPTIVKSQKLHLPIEAEDKVETLSRRRKLLADHLQKASQIIPHVTTFAEVDVSEMVTHRDGLKHDFAVQHSQKLTYTHYLQFAVVQSIKEFPQINSWLNDDEWVMKKAVNLGFATALPSGNLIVPNVKKVNELNFVALVNAVNEKAEQARTNKLQPNDIEHTTFTVSNTGMFGSTMGTPIVSLPQVAVLAFGQIARKPVVKKVGDEEKVVPASVMMLSLSYDHRVIDGALASRFLVHVSEMLQTVSSWAEV